MLLAVFLSSGLCLAARPNIILIMSDDMGFSDLGCYGGEIETPRLDELAKEGIRFTQFYNSARCCPTRASLITGLYPHQAGIGHMIWKDDQLPGYRGDLQPNAVTFGQVLKSAGYSTYCVGKWHVSHHFTSKDPKHNWPLQRGFDRYYGLLTGSTNYFNPANLARDNTPISPFNDPEYTPKEDYYLTHAFTDQAIRFIKEHSETSADRPFFLYLAYTAAHWPMQAPEKAIERYRGKYDQGYEPIRKARYEAVRQLGLVAENCRLTPQAESWEKVKNKAWEARCMEVYAAMITEMDRGIGEIVDQLKQNGQEENTVIFFLQDNGACAENEGRKAVNGITARPEKPAFDPIPADHVIEVRRVATTRTRDGYPVVRGDGIMPGPVDSYIGYGRGWANVSNTPFREYKHWVHEGGIATPLIVRASKKIAKDMEGRLYHGPGHLVDLMPTLVELSGATYPEKDRSHDITPMEGVSLVPAFSGKPLDRQKPIFWEHEGNRAVRDGKWKLVAKGPEGKWELYDMETDRSETHDLSSQHPEKAGEMAARWNEWAVRAKAVPWPWKPKQ